MKNIDRRQFFQATAASYLLGSLASRASSAPSKITEKGTLLTVEQPGYTWEWSREDDRFRILDQQGRPITSGPIQPALIVQDVGQSASRRSTAAKLESHQVQGNRVVWTYGNVNGSGKLSVAWHFDERGPWIEPATYETTAAEDVISLNLFADCTGNAARPSLETNALVLPGICESEAISPIVSADIGLNTRTSLGRTGTGLMQQWALPSHYFCGFRGRRDSGLKGSGDVTRAFCCGLTELPNGDVFVEQRGGRGSLVFDYRSDLWGQLRGPGKFTLGAGLLWALAPNYYEAIREYYRGLLAAGIIHKKTNSAKKNAALLTPQWCTWGEQVAAHKTGSHLDQASLEKFYQELKASGMQAGMFSIDDKWEGKYGNLQHSTERFPHFEQFLDRVRAEGHRIGMWAAFMRCEDPADIGLTPGQMLRRVDGKPYVVGEGATKYYILDFTRPEVEKVLSDLARRYVRRYKPDLVKFDFGYEIPALNIAAPHDMRWAGERMLGKGLDVVVKSMRQENPDIVVMYYELSPLFTDYFDLHSPDDLFEAKGEYDLEANRRFFFSGLCGEFGMPTYGSSGYDWVSQPDIWFDSVAIGTLGCLGSFGGNDEAGSKPTPERLAKYNGLAHLVRPTNLFTIQPLDAVYDSPTRGAHASSWARLEDNKVVLVTLRPWRLNGGKGTTEFGGILSATTQVAVASMTQDSVSETAKLGVVPYGEGRLTLRRASKATVAADSTEHYFGGQSRASRLEVRDGVLAIPLRERGDDGSPVEWIEIGIHA
ncbi:MAG: TIM-barrel domain-containing protein [Terriglobia bacterium]